ncbi:MAG: hypothetical protein HOV78_05065 [Hamadaea sp.]|nr:hypothetical protein [Hamadaea sp.]
MTAPRLKRNNFGSGGHAYRVDCNCPGRYRKTDPHKATGVTTALGALAKPGLTGWAGRVTAEYAVDNWDVLTHQPPSERLETLKGVQYRTKTRAAMKGNELHATAEKLVRGEDVYVPDEARAEANRLARWLDREEYVGWGGEVPCVNLEHRYAGTLDNAGVLGRRGLTALVDFKRTNRIYEENVYQLAAYRYADLWQPDGPASETAMPEFDGAFVVHITPDAVELVPVEADRSAWTEFLYILQVHRDMEAARDDSRIGAALPSLPDNEEDTPDGE